MQGTTRLFVARHSTYACHEIRIHESKRLLKLPLPVDTIGTVTYTNPHNSNLCSFVLKIEVRQGTHPNGWTISSAGIPRLKRTLKRKRDERGESLILESSSRLNVSGGPTAHRLIVWRMQSSETSILLPKMRHRHLRPTTHRDSCLTPSQRKRNMP